LNNHTAPKADSHRFSGHASKSSKNGMVPIRETHTSLNGGLNQDLQRHRNGIRTNIETPGLVKSVPNNSAPATQASGNHS
jgi:hypothetical protein